MATFIQVEHSMPTVTQTQTNICSFLSSLFTPLSASDTLMLQFVFVTKATLVYSLWIPVSKSFPK